MIFENDKFKIPEKYRNMTIDELKEEKRKILKEKSSKRKEEKKLPILFKW